MSLMVCRDVRFIWRCRWRNSCGRFNHHRLPSQQQYGSTACVHGCCGYRGSLRVEADAQTALLQGCPSLSERHLGGNVQSGYVLARQTVCECLECEVY